MSQFGQVGSTGLLGAALGALSFGPFADVFGRKWFMIVAIVVFAVFSLADRAFGVARATPGLSFLRRPRPRRRDSRISRHGRRTCSEAPARRVRHRVVCVISRRRPHRFADQRMGDSRRSAGKRCSISARSRRSSSRSSWQSGCRNRFASCSRATFARTKCAARSSRIMPGQIPRRRRTRRAARSGAQGVPVNHLFTEGRAIPTVLLWVPFFMAFMVLLTVTFWTPSVLNSVGFSLSAAALIVGLNNFGSVCASAMSGWLVHRTGAYRVLIPRLHHRRLVSRLVRPGDVVGVCFAHASLLAGFFVGGTGTGLIAVAAGMYPTPSARPASAGRWAWAASDNFSVRS